MQRSFACYSLAAMLINQCISYLSAYIHLYRPLRHFPLYEYKALYNLNCVLYLNIPIIHSHSKKSLAICVTLFYYLHDLLPLYLIQLAYYVG